MNRLILTALVLGLVCAFAASSPAKQGGKKVVCYFGSWAVYRPGDGKFEVENIDPHLCTHIIYGFVGLDPVSNTIRVLDEWQELEENWGRAAFKRFTGLKAQNPSLKALIAIGGWNEGSENYSNMARDPVKRRAFVNSVVPFLQKHNFDGFDLDWEYPANREGARPEDKENFITLIKELRVEMDKYGYLLTAAVGAGLSTMATAYNIQEVANGLDFINIMAYDFHGAWEDFTGHHSPLYANPEIDTGDNIYLNSDFAVRYWIENGAPPEKLILGIGSYGRGFLLDDTSKNGLYAPAGNPIPAAPYTREVGFWGYNEICDRIKREPGWTVIYDPVYQVPYGFHGRNWIGFDNAESVANKGRYITEMGLGGGMFWSIETDDFRGLCHADENFKLIRTLKRSLNGDAPPPAPEPEPPVEEPEPPVEEPEPPVEEPEPPVEEPEPPVEEPEPEPPSSGEGGDGEICKQEGIAADPAGCSEKFYYCTKNMHTGAWVVTQQNCSPGLVFDEVIKTCNFRGSVASCN